MHYWKQAVIVKAWAYFASNDQQKNPTKIEVLNEKTDPADLVYEINDFFIGKSPSMASKVPNSFIDLNLDFDESRGKFQFVRINSDIDKKYGNQFRHINLQGQAIYPLDSLS